MRIGPDIGGENCNPMTHERCDLNLRFRKAKRRRKRRNRTVPNRTFSAGQRDRDGGGRKQPDPDSSRVVGTFVGTHRPTVSGPTFAGASQANQRIGFNNAAHLPRGSRIPEQPNSKCPWTARSRPWPAGGDPECTRKRRKTSLGARRFARNEAGASRPWSAGGTDPPASARSYAPYGTIGALWWSV